MSLRRKGKRRLARTAFLLSAALTALVFLARSQAQPGLQVSYGAKGLQTLSYRGEMLEDVGRFPADAFHIWHMKVTDLAGRELRAGEDTWGESARERTWNPTDHTWTYRFPWGSIRTQYVQHGDTLDIVVTEENRAGSAVQFCGATLYPLALHFPRTPAGFARASDNQYAFNTTGPSVTVADYGTGQVAAVVTDALKPLYSGFQPASPANTYTALVSSTSPDALATFQPHFDRAVAPGHVDRYTVSLRFAASGTPTRSMAADAYAAWATAWPQQLHWPDRRIIGTAYLASSAQGDAHHPAGYPNNPRRYFNTGDPSQFDVRDAAGLLRFQHRVLQQAVEIVHNLKRLNAQALITWDVEGEPYPMDTSYVCAPDQIAAVAPEMESIVSEGPPPYRGMKLDDAYFRIIRDSGFRVGVCVRPQHLAVHSDGSAQQVTLPSDAEVQAELLRKMRYAHDRWGATVFYIDSTVDANGAPLNAAIFQHVAAALPDSLLIPEESTPKDYAYTAPFLTFLFHGDLRTDPAIYSMYPNAFSANLVNDVDPATLAAHRPALESAIQHGDVLMVHADSWHPNNDAVLRMYADAQRASKAEAKSSR